MSTKRTDLAVEAQEIWQESAGRTTTLAGVEATERGELGFKLTTVKILDERGSEALSKPPGTYVTLELDALLRHEDDSFSNCALALKAELQGLLKLENGESVLVVGLGNPAITPDSIGPRAIDNTIVTWHLVERAPEHFGSFRRVSVLRTGVLGTTGVESAELVRAVVERTYPDRVICIDALCSRKLSRVCRTVQLADTGIIPGSGVGNGRAALNSELLGVPVISLGVPTVVDAVTLTSDMIEQSGGSVDMDRLSALSGDMLVTPKEIDSQVNTLGKLIGYALNMALHDDLDVADVAMFLN